MAAVENMETICRFFKYGFCKYGEKCRKHHVQEICSASDCSRMECEKRHPRICRYFNLYGTCKFGLKCCYLHQSHVSSEIENLKKEIEKLHEKQLQNVLQKAKTCSVGLEEAMVGSYTSTNGIITLNYDTTSSFSDTQGKHFTSNGWRSFEWFGNFMLQLLHEIYRSKRTKPS